MSTLKEYIYAKTLQKRCKNYAETMQKKYAETMQKLSRNDAKTMQKRCKKNYAETMQKLTCLSNLFWIKIMFTKSKH